MSIGPPPTPVDLSIDLGLFQLQGSPYIDRWMAATEIERVFDISVAQVFRLSDDPGMRALGFPRGSRALGSQQRVWRASQVAHWCAGHKPVRHPATVLAST